MGDFQALIDIYAPVLRVDPPNPLPVNNNAVILSRASRFDEARALIDRLRTISPTIYRGGSGYLASVK